MLRQSERCTVAGSDVVFLPTQAEYTFAGTR